MTVITTRLTVGADGAVSVAAPLPAGDYVAGIEVSRQILRELVAATTRPQPWAKAGTLAERRLLTFNGADFRRFSSVIEVVAP